MSKRVRIRIFCDAESHAPKVATVGRLKLLDRGNGDEPLLVGGRDSEYLVDDQMRGRRELFGTATEGPNMAEQGTYRERRAIECPLCGLRVEMRRDTALKLALALAASGASQVRLSALAGSL